MGTCKPYRQFRTRCGALILGLAASLSACTFIFNADQRQCEADSECSINRGFANSYCDLATHTCQEQDAPPEDPKWGCIGQTLASDPPVVVVSLNVLDPFTRLPRRDAQVRVCASLDTGCTNALTNAVPVDVDGAARLNVPTNQSVYFEITSTAEPPTFLPTITALQKRTILGQGGGRGVLLFTQDQIQALTRDVGGFTPDTALLIMSALDCQNTLSAGVQYELVNEGQLTDSTVLFYTNADNVPVSSEKQAQTVSTGNGGFTNLLEGPTSIVANVTDVSKPMTPLPFNFSIRKGWVHEIFLAP
jgi:hypothetical protein